MLNELKALLDKIRPRFKSNIDPDLYDYDFWTKTEKTAKKEREKALEKALKHRKETDITEGTVVNGMMYSLELKITQTSKFDKEVFIEKLLEKYGKTLNRVELRELATASVVPAGDRKAFSITSNTEGL
jgi:hypothetical protein